VEDTPESANRRRHMPSPSSISVTLSLVRFSLVTLALGSVTNLQGNDAKSVTSVTKTPVTSSLIVPTIDEPDTLGERWDNLGRLYKDDENDILQELWVLGRYHGQYHWAEGSAGDSEAFETRRFRVGGQAKLFEKLTLHAQMVSGSDFEPFYNGFTELWAQWAFSPAFALTLGQQKHRFTHDRNVSSRYINYLERSMLTNMFGADYTPAVTLLGKINKLTYYTGLFSNATGTNMGEAFTRLDSGYSVLAAAYYDLGKPLGWDTAHLYFSYLHSDANENATNLDRFDDGIASAFIFTDNSLAVVTEVTAGLGSEAGDAVALNFQPSYFITDNLQLAARYQIATSNDEKGLRAQRRYEREAGLPSGDLYQAAYLGLDYYIAKHRLKIMTGLEYATMGGEDVWTASTMIRFFFGPHSGGPFPMNQMCAGHFFPHD
jgi:phosphate-selective porin OprO/OprP